MQTDSSLPALSAAGVAYSAVVVRDGDRTAQRHADVPRPPASCIKVAHLQAVLALFEAGIAAPGDGVALSRWHSYHLPNSDGGAFEAATRDAGLLTASGDLSDRAVPISRLLVSMLHYSDNAAADLLSEIVGPDGFGRIMSAPPPLILEMMLRLLDAQPGRVSERSAQLAARYVSDPASRDRIARRFASAARSRQFAEHAAWGAAAYRIAASDLLAIAQTHPLEPWLPTHASRHGAPVSAKFGMLPGVVSGVLTSVVVGSRVLAVVLSEGLTYDAYEEELRTARLRRKLIELTAGAAGDLESALTMPSVRGRW